MKLEDLEKNTLIKEIVDNIIADETFKRKCDMNFKRIFEDGKVDQNDIPLMINLIITVYNNHNKIKVSKKNMKYVFMLLISRLLVEFKGDSGLDEGLILLMLEPQIDILLMVVSFLTYHQLLSEQVLYSDLYQLRFQQLLQKIHLTYIPDNT